MGRRRAAVIFIMVILAFAGIMLVWGMGKAQREPDSGEEETIDVKNASPG